jgi:PAS domain S-box-containing protein
VVSLKNLQDDLQQIAEAIMAVTGLDVTIMNKNLKRIAGTGKYALLVGKVAPRNTVFEKAIITGKQYVILEPRLCEECRDCYGRDDCDETAEVCYPIESEQGIEGVIGMIAFTQEQKEEFVKKQKAYMNFVSRMSRLISSRIREQVLHAELRYKSIELRTIIDAVDEGIIAIDDRGKILCINHWAKGILGVRDKEVVGKNLDKVLPKNSVTKVLKTNTKIKDQEEVLTVNGSKLRFLLSAKPIIFDSKKAGAVATLKDFDKLHRSILKISANPNAFSFNRILGSSPSFQKAKEQARQVARQDVTTLLLGESGTGKELFARAIHSESLRKGEIFLPINCGAIPDTLIESELFGYEKGSFTGASPKGKAGKFEMANGGTIFLDEIGDMPLHMQVKLLRVLQERQVMRIGGLSPVKIDVRIIAATNKDLWDMVQKGEFREDLYYRLNVVPIRIPPLRERPEDILELALKLLDRYQRIYDKSLKGISEDAKNFLLSCPLPGNVRELENLIEYGVIFEKSDYLTAETLAKKGGNQASKPSENRSLKELVEQYEKQIIEDLLNHYGWDAEAKKRVAAQLQISQATLYRKIKDIQKQNIFPRDIKEKILGGSVQ